MQPTAWIPSFSHLFSSWLLIMHEIFTRGNTDSLHFFPFTFFTFVLFTYIRNCHSWKVWNAHVHEGCRTITFLFFTFFTFFFFASYLVNVFNIYVLYGKLDVRACLCIFLVRLASLTFCFFYTLGLHFLLFTPFFHFSLLLLLSFDSFISFLCVFAFKHDKSHRSRDAMMHDSCMLLYLIWPWGIFWCGVFSYESLCGDYISLLHLQSSLHYPVMIVLVRLGFCSFAGVGLFYLYKI